MKKHNSGLNYFLVKKIPVLHTFLIFNNCQYISNVHSLFDRIELSPFMFSILLPTTGNLNFAQSNHVTMYSLLDAHCSKS